MPGVLEESKIVCDQKKIEYQELLKVNYKKFLLYILFYGGDYTINKPLVA